MDQPHCLVMNSFRLLSPGPWARQILLCITFGCQDSQEKRNYRQLRGADFLHKGVNCSLVKLETKKRSVNIPVLLHLKLGQLSFTRNKFTQNALKRSQMFDSVHSERKGDSGSYSLESETASVHC